jgi:hypothetical protein
MRHAVLVLRSTCLHLPRLAPLQAFLVLYLALLVAAIFMLGELLSFHVVLIWKDMTTCE